MTTSRRLILVALVAALAVALAACAGGAAIPAPSESGSPSASPPATGAPPATGDPDRTDDGEPSDPGEVVTSPPDGGNGGFPPGGPGQPEFVQPQPGQQIVHPVAITELIARVSGNHVELNAKWWSGVEPCSVLDSIEVAREGTTFTIGLFEGTSDPDAMCIAVAVEKVTLVDLGELASGTYTVRASMGEAPDITVTVP